MTAHGPGNSFLATLGRIHDGITRIGFFIAAVCLAAIVFIYCYEVVARYFFSAPTVWADASVAYLLCYMVFLAMPELSRQKVHIFISIVLDTMPKSVATAFQHAAYVVAAIACLAAAIFCLDATFHQYLSNIETVNEWRVKKWMLSISIPYGLFSTCLYYVRHVARREQYQTTEAMPT